MFERCERCHGPMVKERFFVRMGEAWNGKRCICCGEITDPIIEENRAFVPVQGLQGRKKGQRDTYLRKRRTIEEMEVMK